MKTRISTLTLLCLLFCISANADKKEYKKVFEILSKYRTDISPDVLKKAKKEMNGISDYEYCKIHDSWIENPYGKSTDLKGNVLFPDITYTKCKQISPTHFELGKYSLGIKYGVARTDNKIIIPIENQKLDYHPESNLIVAFVDWEPYSYQKKKGLVKIYDYNGTIVREIPNCSEFLMLTPLSDYSTGTAIKWTDDTGKHEDIMTNCVFHRSVYDLDLITSFFYEGPQAVTYNIIRDLFSSKNKKEQEEALLILDYFMISILPEDTYSRTMSRVAWDATCRKLAYLNTVKLNSAMLAKDCMAYRYLFDPSFFANGTKPSLWNISKKCLPEIKLLHDKAQVLLDNAVNICYNRMIKQAERERVWAAVLGVLAGGMNGNNQFSTTGTAATNTSKTATQPYTVGNRMIDKTTVGNEIMGAAIMSGWTPEAPQSKPSSQSSATSSTSRRVCHACYGNKKHQACNGSGIQLAFGNKRTEKCSGCHGSGDCPQCNGTGYH